MSNGTTCNPSLLDLIVFLARLTLSATLFDVKDLLSKEPRPRAALRPRRAPRRRLARGAKGSRARAVGQVSALPSASSAFWRGLARGASCLGFSRFFRCSRGKASRFGKVAGEAARGERLTRRALAATLAARGSRFPRRCRFLACAGKLAAALAAPAGAGPLAARLAATASASLRELCEVAACQGQPSQRRVEQAASAGPLPREPARFAATSAEAAPRSRRRGAALTAAPCRVSLREEKARNPSHRGKAPKSVSSSSAGSAASAQPA